MFVDFFYFLKERLPVSITEYLTLLEALGKGLINNMVDFYYISRSILCKNEHLFDIFDCSFGTFFEEASIKFPVDIRQEIWNWLQKDVNVLYLLQEVKEMFEDFDLEALERQLEQLLKEQDKEHDFGNKWIGTQGQSPFGHSGQNTIGFRLGNDSGMRRAIRIAQKRIFKDYRKDVVLDTRQVKIALKRLRRLDDIGNRCELNLKKTIAETSKNGGEIELVFEKKKKNNLKLLLLMDVGGTMDPYVHRVNLLFSAANNMSHWKDFKYFYFHNCIYNFLYDNARRNPKNALEFNDFLKKYDSSYRVVIVGDQTMHRSELKRPYGAIYDGATNKKPGIYYLERIADHFKKNVVWLSPEADLYNWSTWTQLIIARILPTYPLSIEGIEKAMDYLRVRGKNQFTTVDMLKGVPLALY